MALSDHPQRHSLIGELHSRPALALAAPAICVHMALLQSPEQMDETAALITGLCQRHGQGAPKPGAAQHVVRLEGLTLKWERHNEFSALLLVQALDGADFSQEHSFVTPADLLPGLAGQTVGASKCFVYPSGQLEDRALAARLFDQPFESLPSALVARDGGQIWSNLDLDAQGFVVFQFRCDPHFEADVGRMVQRLHDIEAYSLLALLAFPLAKAAAPRLRQIGGRLEEITSVLSTSEDRDNESELLHRLTGLAAENERIGSQLGYRIGAAEAYETIVRQRLQELRESRAEGHPLLSLFLLRRLAPAITTCRSVARRQAVLSERIGRATTLLRARVDVALQQQNAGVLASMNRRAQQQLRLQETVEGLSVFAISYYAVGLLGYLVEGGLFAFLPLGKSATMMALVALTLPLVWLGARLTRRRLTRTPPG